MTSADGRTAYTTVSFDRQVKTLGHAYTGSLGEATAPTRAAGVRVAYGGDLDEVVREPANDKASPSRRRRPRRRHQRPRRRRRPPSRAPSRY
ncbi:hypothetical protein [Streptomyces sp. NPDC048272]|uniref:hypothetical protein n=1 Tax=Streptomyces sp. NPDC048272 TaxID=3154616 RepID=UPI00342B374C